MEFQNYAELNHKCKPALSILTNVYCDKFGSMAWDKVTQDGLLIVARNDFSNKIILCTMQTFERKD